LFKTQDKLAIGLRRGNYFYIDLKATGVGWIYESSDGTTIDLTDENGKTNQLSISL